MNVLARKDRTKVEHSGAKCKATTEAVAPVEGVSCGEQERDLLKMWNKLKQSQKLHAAGEYHTSFQSPNVQHVEFLTKQRRELPSRLGNAEILSKLYIDIRANQLFYHSKCLKTKLSNIIMKCFWIKVGEQSWQSFQRSECTWKYKKILKKKLTKILNVLL